MSVGNVSEFNPKADDYWKNTEHLSFLKQIKMQMTQKEEPYKLFKGLTWLMWLL